MVTMSDLFTADFRQYVMLHDVVIKWQYNCAVHPVHRLSYHVTVCAASHCCLAEHGYISRFEERKNMVIIIFSETNINLMVSYHVFYQ